MHQLNLVVPTPVNETRDALEIALKAQGFGILSEIDLQATFKAKLGVEHEAHRILGVCKPTLAKQALDLDRDVALLLPCTITLREVEAGTEVRALDPQDAFRLAAPATRTQLEPLADAVSGQIAEAFAQLVAASV